MLLETFAWIVSMKTVRGQRQVGELVEHEGAELCGSYVTDRMQRKRQHQEQRARLALCPVSFRTENTV